MIPTYTITQLAELEGVSRTTMSTRVNKGDPRYIALKITINSRAKDGYSVVYARTSDLLNNMDSKVILDRVSERLEIHKENT